MEKITGSLGLKRLCVGAAAALLIMSPLTFAAQNPWGDSLLKFNIPYTHGSGVFVDLGNEKVVNGTRYREPAGLCPVMGKMISLLQPTTDLKIWPRNYLARVPTKGSAQDTQPLGGGLAMWETTPTKISPLTAAELESMAAIQKGKNTPDAIASKRLEEVVDNHGRCAWWAWVTYAKSKGNDLNAKYRYPFVWDENTQTCTLLGIAMQLLDGKNKYCSDGDGNPRLSWYCFYPQKAEDTVSYNSAYVRPDHKTACPERPLMGAHFGVWNGTTCTRMIPRARQKLKEPAACGKAVFVNSASDNPTKYTTAPELQGMQQDYQRSVATLWPAGAFGADQPHSKGIGINYGNWYADGTCELYDTVPNCLIRAPGQLAYTALGTVDPKTAELPPCNAASEGWEIFKYCECGSGTLLPLVCKSGKWEGEDSECYCSNNVLAISLGVTFGVILLGCLIGLYFYLRSRKAKSNPKNDEKKRLLSEDNTQEEEFVKGTQRRKHKQSDMAQEAEPSFWGEPNHQTNVIMDDEPHEMYY